MQRIILGTLAAAVAAAALTGCDATFSASPSANESSPAASSSTQNGGSTHNSGGSQGGRTSTKTGSGNGGSGTRHCTTSDFTMSVYANGRPGAGQRYGTLQLENKSGSSCTTGGWSGLALMDENGTRPTRVIREGKAHTLTIPAGASAYEQLHWTVVPAGDESNAQCNSEPESLRVIPPNQTTHQTLSWNAGNVCGGGQIRLTPIKLGKLN